MTTTDGDDGRTPDALMIAIPQLVIKLAELNIRERCIWEKRSRPNVIVIRQMLFDKSAIMNNVPHRAGKMKSKFNPCKYMQQNIHVHLK